MKIKKTYFITFLFVCNIAFGQKEPTINITYSKLLATYDFVQKLSEKYPDNEYKKLFYSSDFNTQHNIDLFNQLDRLNIYESYDFQDYPITQKVPVMTTSLIERNLINATTIKQFKQQTFGIIPNAELLAFSNIISEFEPV